MLHYFYHSDAFDADDGANPSGGLIMDKTAHFMDDQPRRQHDRPIRDRTRHIFKLTPVDAGKRPGRRLCWIASRAWPMETTRCSR